MPRRPGKAQPGFRVVDLTIDKYGMVLRLKPARVLARSMRPVSRVPQFQAWAERRLRRRVELGGGRVVGPGVWTWEDSYLDGPFLKVRLPAVRKWPKELQHMGQVRVEPGIHILSVPVPNAAARKIRLA